MFRWGLLGSGFISSQFAKGIDDIPEAEVYAVASISGNNPYGICAKKYYRDYEALVKDSKIDAVYVGTIHPQHFPCVKLCLMAGKPVLCEKPIALNSKQLIELINLANEKNTFFMEAMWTRYLPAARYIRDILQEGHYGKVHYMNFTFGNRADRSAKRLFDASLGGGALLDIGVYGLNLAKFWMGEEPNKIHSWAEQDNNTIDLTTSIQLSYKNGAVADMMFSINKNLPNSAYIVTDKAEFEIPYFWRPNTVLQYTPNRDFILERIECKKEFSIVGNGYSYEALEVMHCVKSELLESSDMTWKDSLCIMRYMDTIRKQCGIKYPQDEE